MEHRQLGRTGMNVTVLGLGAAEIGFEKISSEIAGRLLNEALDAGLNVIDTAECYLQSEELIGQTVAHRRREYFLFSKCGHPESPSVADWRPESLLPSIERSLRRLKTDRLDLIQLHTCTEADLRQGDVITALQTARAKGHARFIGYSGDGTAAKYAIECGAFDVLQTSVSIADQEAIDLTLPLARDRGMGVIAKRPIANAAWRHPAEPADGYVKPYWQRLTALNYDFTKGDLTQAVATALRFTLVAPGIDTAIVGTSKPGRFAANMKLLEAGPLPQQEYETIRARWREVAPASWTGRT